MASGPDPTGMARPGVFVESVVRQRALASGEVTVPDNASKEDEEKLLRQAVARPLVVGTREVEGHAAVQEGPRHGIGAGADVGQRKFAQGHGHLPVGLPGLLAGGKHLVVGAGSAGRLGVILE